MPTQLIALTSQLTRVSRSLIRIQPTPNIQKASWVPNQLLDGRHQIPNHFKTLHRSTSTSSTAYPSGSVKNPTKVIPSTSISLSKSQRKGNPSGSNSIPFAHRTLPALPDRRPLYILTFLAISGIWVIFVYFSTNAEKANSSVVKAVLFELRTNPMSQEALGTSIRPEKDDLFGQLWVDGQINLMQGAVDVAFRVTGSSGSGKVYFTSVRRERDSEFEIIRWKLIRDDGTVFDLSKEPAPTFFTGDGTSTLIKPPRGS